MLKISSLGFFFLACAFILQPAARADTADKCFASAIELRFQGDTDSAISQYRRGLELKPQAVDARMQLGAVLLDERGDVDGAISEFVTALGVDPGCRYCRLELNDALEKRMSTPEAQIARGNQFFACGDWRRAVGAFRLAIALEPGNAYAHNSLAWTLYHQGRLIEGLAEVKEALVLKPDNPEFLNTLASLLLDRGELSGARLNFKRAIAHSKEPNAADLYGLAVISLTTGDTAAAARQFAQALVIDPHYKDEIYLRDRIGLSVQTLSSHERLLFIVSGR